MKKNKKIILKKYLNHYWSVADLEIYKNDKLEKVININKFYEINENYINIYETIGGSGVGYKKGDLLQKIEIDCNFETIESLKRSYE
jgi:hypothetical protein